MDISEIMQGLIDTQYKLIAKEIEAASYKASYNRVLDYICSGKDIYFGIEPIITDFSLPMREEYMIIYPETKEVHFKTKLEVLKDMVRAEEEKDKHPIVPEQAFELCFNKNLKNKWILLI